MWQDLAILKHDNISLWSEKLSREAEAYPSLSVTCGGQQYAFAASANPQEEEEGEGEKEEEEEEAYPAAASMTSESDEIGIEDAPPHTLLNHLCCSILDTW